MAQLTADSYPVCPDAAQACYAKWQNLAVLLLQNLWEGDFLLGNGLINGSVLPHSLPSVRKRFKDFVFLWAAFLPLQVCCRAQEAKITVSVYLQLCVPSFLQHHIPLSQSRIRQTEPASSSCSFLLESEVIWKCLLVVRPVEGSEEETLVKRWQCDSRVSLRRLEYD